MELHMAMFFFKKSKARRCRCAPYQVSVQYDIYQDRCGNLSYPNVSATFHFPYDQVFVQFAHGLGIWKWRPSLILERDDFSILNLRVALAHSTKFRFSRTCGWGYVLRISIWRPSWIWDGKNYHVSSMPQWVQSDICLRRRCRWRISTMVAILDIWKEMICCSFESPTMSPLEMPLIVSAQIDLWLWWCRICKKANDGRTISSYSISWPGPQDQL